MALVNVACLLAARQREMGGKKVLMIDWDLNAPGLHSYFSPAKGNRFQKLGGFKSSGKSLRR